MVDEIIVRGNQLEVNGVTYRCCVGRSGITTAKKEGDGKTPAGIFPLREVFYRPDRLPKPECQLPITALSKQDGWCDAPDDTNYNRRVVLPYPASHEELWRQDEVYDLIVVVGYNDDPIHPGAGSAIFMHIVRGDYNPTMGCVSLKVSDLLATLSKLSAQSRIRIESSI